MKRKSSSQQVGYKKRKSEIPAVTRGVLKKLIRWAAEAKHYAPYDSVTPASGSIYTAPLTANITQGGGTAQRDGDSIRLEYIKIDLMLRTSSYLYMGNHPALFRVLLVEAAGEYNGGAMTWTTSGLTTALMYQGANTFNNVDGIPDPKLITVHYDATHQLDPKWAYGVQVTGDTTSTELARTIKKVSIYKQIQKDIVFKRGSNFTTGRNNFYLVVAPYNGNGASNLDTMSYVADVCFKDTK